VTRNHKHKTLPSLCREVARWLDAASLRVVGQAMEPLRLRKAAT
jgi:hypothetical protein